MQFADYVNHLKLNNSPRSARDTELRLKKYVPASILGTELTKLTTIQLQLAPVSGQVKRG